jgi:hypothetical protein
MCFVLMLAATGKAHAQGIIYGYFNPVAQYPLAAQSSLDFNGDGINELQINYAFYDLGLDWTSMDCSLGGTAQSLSPIFQGFSAGAAIAPNAGVWADLSGSLIYWSEFNGQNNSSQTHFALSSASPYLPIDFDLSDGVHYGWVRFQTNGFFGFQDWAYESEPNTPIAAGTVPEPGTWVLFSSGIFAVQILRRKSKFSCSPV